MSSKWNNQWNTDHVDRSASRQVDLIESLGFPLGRSVFFGGGTAVVVAVTAVLFVVSAMLYLRMS